MPDLGNHVKRLLPLIVTIAGLAAYIALVVFLLWAPKLRKRWQLITSRIIGALAILPLAVVLPALLLGFMLNIGNPPTQTRIVRSQKGQEATVNYSAGFLGRDYTEVTVKSPDSCRHVIVFWHGGPSVLDDMKIEWQDEHQLHLTYHARPDDPQHCEQRVGEITIVCASQVWN